MLFRRGFQEFARKLSHGQASEVSVADQGAQFLEKSRYNIFKSRPFCIKILRMEPHMKNSAISTNFVQALSQTTQAARIRNESPPSRRVTDQERSGNGNHPFPDRGFDHTRRQPNKVRPDHLNGCKRLVRETNWQFIFIAITHESRIPQLTNVGNRIARENEACRWDSKFASDLSTKTILRHRPLLRHARPSKRNM